MIIKTDRVELEILPGESVFVGIKDERGQDAEAVFQEWTELAPFGEVALEEILAEVKD